MSKTSKPWTWNSISKRFHKLMKQGRLTKVIKVSMKGKGNNTNGKRIKKKASASN